MSNLSVDPPVRFRLLLRRVVERIREKGISWTFRRAIREIAVPTTGAGRLLNSLYSVFNASLNAPRYAFFRLAMPGLSASDTLYAFYDLAVEPVTYDILWFLAGADAMRERLGLERIHIVIVSGPDDGFREETEALEKSVDKKSRRWRVQNILVASTDLLPTSSGCSVCQDRRQARLLFHAARHIYPDGYRVSTPVAHTPAHVLDAVGRGNGGAVLRASDQALRYARQWLEPRTGGLKPVSITLREYNFTPKRNSNIPAWTEFARQIVAQGFFPVFVQDTELSLKPDDGRFDGLAVFAEASWNVALRMALYELCYLNLGINTGPMALCWLNGRTRSLTFKLAIPGLAETSDEAYRVRGFEPYRTPDLANPFLKWVWEDDRQEIIFREFEAMRTRIDASGEAPVE